MTVGAALGRKIPNSDGLAGNRPVIQGVAARRKVRRCWADDAQRSNTRRLFVVAVVFVGGSPAVEMEILGRELAIEEFQGGHESGRILA